MSTYKQYTIKNTVYFISIYPLITLDSEKGLAIFDGSIVKTRGTYNGLKLNPGKNLITIDGNIKSATIVKRSAWL